MPLVEDEQQLKLHGDPRAEPDFTIEQIQALQAVARGNASTDQQKRAMQYIIENVCGSYDTVFRPSGTNQTMVAAGKQIVGQHLVKLIKLRLKKRGATGEQPNV